MATFIHDGNSVDHTPGSAVTAGQVVVQGELVGVAKVDIPANALGALAVVGVFDFPKATGVGTAISAGANCYWNAAAQQATTTATRKKLIGKCARAAVDADTTVRIRMLQ